MHDKLYNVLKRDRIALRADVSHIQGDIMTKCAKIKQLYPTVCLVFLCHAINYYNEAKSEVDPKVITIITDLVTEDHDCIDDFEVYDEILPKIFEEFKTRLSSGITKMCTKIQQTIGIELLDKFQTNKELKLC